MNQQGTQLEFPSEAGKESNSNRNSENAYEKLNDGLLGEYKQKNTKRRKTSSSDDEEDILSPADGVKLNPKSKGERF